MYLAKTPAVFLPGARAVAKQPAWYHFDLQASSFIRCPLRHKCIWSIRSFNTCVVAKPGFPPLPSPQGSSPLAEDTGGSYWQRMHFAFPSIFQFINSSPKPKCSGENVTNPNWNPVSSPDTSLLDQSAQNSHLTRTKVTTALRITEEDSSFFLSRSFRPAT